MGQKQTEATDTHCERATRINTVQSEALSFSLVATNTTIVVSGGLYVLGKLQTVATEL